MNVFVMKPDLIIKQPGSNPGVVGIEIRKLESAFLGF